MALIKCPECGGQVSDQAVACPHCGYQIGKQSSETNTVGSNHPEAGNSSSNSGCGTAIGVVFLIILGLIIYVLIASKGASSGLSGSSGGETKAIAAATMYIQQNYYSDASLSKSKATITNVGARYSISGTFDRKGVVHHYAITLRLTDNGADIISCSVN